MRDKPVRKSRLEWVLVQIFLWLDSRWTLNAINEDTVFTLTQSMAKEFQMRKELYHGSEAEFCNIVVSWFMLSYIYAPHSQASKSRPVPKKNQRKMSSHLEVFLNIN